MPPPVSYKSISSSNMRIALYVRKSTEQEDRQIQSIEDQTRELTSLAHREGWTIARVFEESMSAKVPNTRPIFQEMMVQVDQGRFDGILCWSLNRIARNEIDGSRVSYALRSEKLLVVRTIDRTYRPEDSALLMAVENGMATAFLQDLSRNVKRGMRGRVDRGWSTSKAPVGYTNNSETREIDCDSKRFHIIRKAWQTFLSGNVSVSEVHRQLVRDKLTIPTRKREVQLISRSAVHLLFKNPFYAGVVRHSGQEFPGRHVPMVTLEEFRRVQDMICGVAPAKKPVERSFAFRKAFVCANCGCAVVGEKRTKTYPKTGRTVEYVYYHCSGSKGCPKIAIREEEIESIFKSYAETMQIRESVAGWLEEKLDIALAGETTARESRVANSEALIGREQERLEKLTYMRIDNELTAVEFDRLRSSILIEIHNLKDQASMVRSEKARIGAKGRQLIHTAVLAGDLAGGPSDVYGLGAFARSCGDHLLNLNKPVVKINPVLQKITSFEPLRNGSENPKKGDNPPSNSVWWTLVDDILNLLIDEDMQRFGTLMQSNLEKQ